MHIYFVTLHDVIAIWHGNVLGRVRQVEVGVHPKGANNMVMYGLGCEKPLVGVGRPLLLILSATDLENSLSPCITSNSRVQGQFFY